MLLDALLAFDPAGTNITVSAASTNVLDAHVTSGLPATGGRELANDGVMLDIFAVVQTAFLAAGAATLQVSLQGAVDAGGNAPGTWFDHIMTGALPKANLTVGVEVLRTPMPYHQPAASGSSVPPRFYRLNYTVATGPFTAGALFAGLIPHSGRNANYAYPNNYNVANV